MSKDFIPYEQSVKVKELGFDEPCLGFYDEMSDNKPVVGISDGCLNSAPTYHQVFRWFREEHNLLCVIGYATINPSHHFPDLKPQVGYSVRIDDMKDVTPGSLINHYHVKHSDELDLFSEYVDAELACLNKMISILIKRNKQNIIKT